MQCNLNEHDFSFILSEEHGENFRRVTSVMCIRCGQILEFKKPEPPHVPGIKRR